MNAMIWVAPAAEVGLQVPCHVDFAEDGAQRTEGEAIWEQLV